MPGGKTIAGAYLGVRPLAAHSITLYVGYHRTRLCLTTAYAVVLCSSVCPPRIISTSLKILSNLFLGPEARSI